MKKRIHDCDGVDGDDFHEIQTRSVLPSFGYFLVFESILLGNCSRCVNSIPVGGNCGIVCWFFQLLGAAVHHSADEN